MATINFGFLSRQIGCLLTLQRFFVASVLRGDDPSIKSWALSTDIDVLRRSIKDLAHDRNNNQKMDPS